MHNQFTKAKRHHPSGQCLHEIVPKKTKVTSLAGALNKKFVAGAGLEPATSSV